MSSDTALGDWYVNRIVVHRQHLLLLASSESLLPMLVPARDVRGLPARLAALVADRLRRCGIEGPEVDAEVDAMTPLTIRPTADRAVLGIMTDFAKSVSYHLASDRWGEGSLRMVEQRLAETPCFVNRSFDRVVFPDQRARELLRSKWLANKQQPTRAARPNSQREPEGSGPRG